MPVALFHQILPWFNRSMWVAAGLLCGVLAANWLAIGLDTGGQMLPVSTSQQDAASQASERLADYSVILERNLFGVAPGSLRDGGVVDESLTVGAGPTQTISDLSLLGTVAGGEAPLALLRSGSELLLVKLGEELPGGRTLEEVRRSEVVVRQRDGSLAVIPLQEGVASTAPPARGQRTLGKPAAGNFQVEDLGGNRWRIPREQAERARTNLNALLKTARMTPNIVDGQTEGFQVVTVQPRSLLAQMGLRPRDVLVEINGVELDSPEKALQIFYQLREARSLSLALRRNGQPLTFDYVVE